jgi:predicted MFS family arabinose efflux permease
MLRDRSIAALLTAEIVSTTGSQMTWLALPWFVLLTSGSATRMSLVVAAELIGAGLFGLPGGKLLARLGARRLMMLCDAARGALILTVPVLHWTGSLSFGLVLAVAFAAGAFTAPYFTAQKVIVPELLGEDEAVVSRASALFQGATRATMLLGPVIGGALIAAFSAPAVLVVDAATYVVAVALVAGFVPRPARSVPAAEDTGIRQGIRFLARERVLRVWAIVFAIGDAAWVAFFISIPVLVFARFGADPRIAGWLLASFGAGALLGNAIAYRVLLDRVRGMTVIGVCVLGQALPLWLLTFHLPASAYSAALAVSGLANGLVNPSIHALMTLRIPPQLRPSVMAAMTVVFTLIQPLGVFGAGPVLDAFGVEPVLVAFAAIQTVTMAAIAATAFRERAAPPVLAGEPV